MMCMYHDFVHKYCFLERYLYLSMLKTVGWGGGGGRGELIVVYSGKFSRHSIFADRRSLTFRGFNFRGHAHNYDVHVHVQTCLFRVFNFVVKPRNIFILESFRPYSNCWLDLKIKTFSFLSLIRRNTLYVRC